MKMVPFLIGADGVVRNGAKRPYRFSRSAPYSIGALREYL